MNHRPTVDRLRHSELPDNHVLEWGHNVGQKWPEADASLKLHCSWRRYTLHILSDVALPVFFCMLLMLTFCEAALGPDVAFVPPGIHALRCMMSRIRPDPLYIDVLQTLRSATQKKYEYNRRLQSLQCFPMCFWGSTQIEKQWLLSRSGSLFLLVDRISMCPQKAGRGWQGALLLDDA